MSHIFRPDEPTHRLCIICGAPDAERHHISYQPRIPEPWRLVRLCRYHHADLGRIYDIVRPRSVPLEIVSAQYIADQRHTQNLAGAGDPYQLSFGDQPTRHGRYWHQWDDAYRRQFAADRIRFEQAALQAAA